MTLVAKILILINLAMSVLMLSFALGVYTQRVDFSTQRATAEKAQGEIGKRRDRIEAQWRGVQTAESRWRADGKVLHRYERSRPANLKWYDAELAKLVKGTDPVGKVERKDGATVLEKWNKEEDNVGRPVLTPAVDRRGQPLRGMEAYKNGYNVAGMPKVWGFTDYIKGIEEEMGKPALDKDGNPLLDKNKKPILQPVLDKDGNPVPFIVDDKKVLDEDGKQVFVPMGKFGKLVIEDSFLSWELGKVKGLEDRLVREQEKQGKIGEEIEYLKPLKYNTEVEAELVLQRREQLQSRKKELEATAPAKVVSK